MALLDRFFRRNPPPVQERANSREPFLAPVWQQNNPQWSDWDSDKATKEGYKASAWVYRSVSLRANAVASVPWYVEVKQGKDWVRPESHPLQTLIDSPNPEMEQQDLMRLLVTHLDLAGNGYWAKVRQGQGVVLELWPMLPNEIEVIPGSEELIKAYRFRTQTTMPAADVAHIAYVNPSSLLLGQSPLQAAAKAVDIDNAAAAFQKISMQNRGIPDGVFTTGEAMTADQFEEARRQVREQYATLGNARTPWVLGGAKWEQMSLSPAEMDFMSTRNLTREEIGVVYGTAEMMASLASANRASAAEVRKSFWLDTIVPLLAELRSALNQSLAREFGPSDQIRIVYDTSGVEALQTNEKEILEVVRGYWGMGVPFNQLNQKYELGFDDIEGGDVGYLPSGLLPTDFDMTAAVSGTPEGQDDDTAPQLTDEGVKALAALTYGTSDRKQ